MATYVIGDVHGCYNELISLLNKINFDIWKDKVIFVGDLVGRGPEPAKVLDLIIGLNSTAKTVLGNYDLKFISAALGIIPITQSDNFGKLLKSPKLLEYIDFISSADLLYYETTSDLAIVHAGISPLWTLKEAQKYSLYFRQYIKDKGINKTLHILNHGKTLKWDDEMSEEDILQYIYFSFSKLRYCYSVSTFDNQYTGYPGTQDISLKPWFEYRQHSLIETSKIIFGHWAALGFYRTSAVTCCDTGCVWGGKLTAIRIRPSLKVTQINSNYYHTQ